MTDAVHDGTLRTRKELSQVFALLDRETIPAIDPQGHPWLVWHAGTREERRAGVDWSNVRAPESDAELAHLLLLARMDAELRGPPKGRPPLPVFAREYGLLEELERDTRAANAMAARTAPLRP